MKDYRFLVELYDHLLLHFIGGSLLGLFYNIST